MQKHDHSYSSFCLRNIPEWIIMAVLAPCCVAIILENFLLIATIFRGAKATLSAVSYLFLNSLAVADVFVGATTLATIVCYVRMLPETGVVYQPLLVLTFLFTLNYSVALLSMFHLSLIALDRYIFIAHPFVYERRVTKRSAKIAVTCCWLLTFLNATISNMPKIVKGDFATCDFRQKLDPGFCSFVTFYFIAGTISSLAYLRIYQVVSYQKRAISSTHNPTALRITAMPQTNNADTDNNRCSGLKVETKFYISRSTLKTIKFFVLVFGLFVVSTFPVIAVSILSFFFPIPNNVALGATLMQNSNSAINFMALVVRDKLFRKEFIKMLKAMCKHIQSYCH
ncbi:hypothetical protein RRG08_015664 [Elysia crispata]|uniref:G-protein coupled receptors family 1 profile domain-containing protein n=1 Tax=Elysia crispata TaxID=231223 RepID=A0AAE1CR72_9GAST|nr:hypothetical protein RRG08_015664 [Elysia crispata]